QSLLHGLGASSTPGRGLGPTLAHEARRCANYNDSLGGMHAATPEAEERRSVMARVYESGRHAQRVGRRSAAAADSNLRQEDRLARGHRAGEQVVARV